MILYVTTDTTDAASFLRVRGSAAPPVWATTVLRHEHGPLGFDHRGGDAVVASLVGSAVVLESANDPDWVALEAGEASLRRMNRKFRALVTATAPAARLGEELARVSERKVQLAKNRVLARHGRPLRPIPSTVFDDWIADGPRIDLGVLRWLMDSSGFAAVWAHSDWGVFARVFGDTEASALAPIVRTGRALGIEVRRVEGAAQMPCW